MVVDGVALHCTAGLSLTELGSHCTQGCSSSSILRKYSSTDESPFFSSVANAAAIANKNASMGITNFTVFICTSVLCL